MDDDALKDLEYRAEFERQQFELYDARRLAAETHANAVIAAALTVAVLVLSDYAREQRPGVAWLLAALGGLCWAFMFANLARVVAWTTPRWRGGPKPSISEPLPSDVVGETLAAARADEKNSVAIRERALAHWRARAHSAWQLGTLKDRRLRQALWGFAGPLAYFAVRLL